MRNTVATPAERWRRLQESPAKLVRQLRQISWRWPEASIRQRRPRGSRRPASVKLREILSFLAGNLAVDVEGHDERRRPPSRRTMPD